MINKICQIDGRIKIESRMLQKKCDQSQRAFYDFSNQYLNIYCMVNNITPTEVVSAINKFREKYQTDLTNFISFQKYPNELGLSNFDLSRNEYDIFLISSLLFLEHRFDLFYRISCLKKPMKKTLIIGCGSGLEISIIKPSTTSITATDISLSAFLTDMYPDVDFIESENLFDTTNYDTVLVIETLEHLTFPYEFLSNIYHKLRAEGLLIISTAKNIPQFDHCYNFSCINDTINNLTRIGFQIFDYTIIPHRYLIANVNAENQLFLLKKQ